VDRPRQCEHEQCDEERTDELVGWHRGQFEGVSSVFRGQGRFDP
jgi:hypothetical protein